MNPNRTVHRNIDTAMHRLAVAEKLAPNVLDDITHRRQQVGASGHENGRGSIGGHSDPTATMAAELASLSDKTKRIVEASELVLRAIDRFDEACRDGLGRKLVTADNEQRCPGWPVGQECGDLQGYSIGDNGHVALDPDGLCDKHRRDKDADERRARDAERAKVVRIDPRAKRA